MPWEFGEIAIGFLAAARLFSVNLVCLFPSNVTVQWRFAINLQFTQSVGERGFNISPDGSGLAGPLLSYTHVDLPWQLRALEEKC